MPCTCSRMRRAARDASRSLAAISDALHSVSGRLRLLSARSRSLQRAVSDVGGALKEANRERAARAAASLAARCLRFGLLVCIAATGVCALRAGRLAELRATCMQPDAGRAAFSSATGLGSVAGWVRAGAQAASRFAWRAALGGGLAGGGGGVRPSWWLPTMVCIAREAGLFAAGGGVLLWLLLPALLRAGPPQLSHGSWLLDLGLAYGVLGGAVGAHVVHCLGGCWATWLACWLVWLACSAAGAVVKPAGRSLTATAAMVLCLAVVGPMAVAVLPFHVLAAPSLPTWTAPTWAM
eukprot:350834-Chlamydomonas_euryale.AAC.4